MNISGIRTYAGFYDYNTIKNQEARNQQIAEAKAQAAETLAVQEEQQCKEANQAIAAPMKPDNGASEYAKQYQPDATYELKGVDSDIANLDVEKALSDMKKDQVLQQYQFFVGESKVGEELVEKHRDENFYL